MPNDVQLHFSEVGAGEDRLSELTGFLREELLQLDVEDVVALPAGPPPTGAKAFDVVAVGALLVTIGRSAFGLRDVVVAVRSWLSRGDDVDRAVRIEIDGDVLDLSAATAAEQQQLIDLFVTRHSGADGS